MRLVAGALSRHVARRHATCARRASTLAGHATLPTVQSCPLPEHALLATYRANGSFTDCYSIDVAGDVSLAQFVAAFYTTFVFRLERLVLKWALSRPSTDEDAQRLAAGTADTFAAWTVEGRGVDQLLLCDVAGRTRSWLMVTPVVSGRRPATRLYFGSAVVPHHNRRAGQHEMGTAFRALLGFHKLYSRVLLRAAVGRL